MVPRDVIEEIRDRVDIVRLVGEAVPLKKVGRNYSGLCPFHQEKTPSFTVNDQKQLYHCFGCGEGGTVFTFLMKFHHLTFPESLERLAPLAGIDLEKYRGGTEESKARLKHRQRLVRVLTYARDLYHNAFLQSAVAREYVASRGISLDTAKKLRIGYAPEGWETLVGTIRRDKQSLEDAHAAGLLGKRRQKEGYYDVFRHRILFPIADPKGQVVGFGGRVVVDGAQGADLGPKYLNSPQTPVFDKGRLLFGLFEAAEAIRLEKKAIIVEGYMDQVALREAGIPNAVATLGTALTQDHARLLRKYTDEVAVVFDGDAAGLKASRRSAYPLLSEGVKARVALLPEGLDPDAFVRSRGKEEFMETTENAVSMIDFYVDRFFRNAKDVNEKASAIQDLSAIAKGTSNVYLREALVDELAEKTGLEKEIIRGGRPFAPQKSKGKSENPAGNPALRRVPKEELVLLRLAAEVSQARQRLFSENVLDMFSLRSFAESAQKWLSLADDFSAEEAPVSAWVDAWEDSETRPQLVGIFMDPVAGATEDWERMFNDCVRKLLRREMSRLRERLPHASEGDSQGPTVDQLNQRILELKRLEQQMGGRSTVNLGR